ncbi:MAG: Hsp20/alpha crystallin family protein [Acetobacteraceae bacterium]
MAKAPTPVKSAPPARRLADPFASLRQEMDQLLDRFTGGFGFPALPRLFDLAPANASLAEFPTPAVDVSEDDKAYVIAAELPGLDEKDIEISVNDDLLVLKGEKRQEREEKDANYHLTERTYGTFQRSFALPANANAAAIEAHFAKGVLTVTVPKKPEAQAKTRKIEVKPAA